MVHLEGRELKLMQIKKKENFFNTSNRKKKMWKEVAVGPGCACESVHTGG